MIIVSLLVNPISFGEAKLPHFFTAKTDHPSNKQQQVSEATQNPASFLNFSKRFFL